MINEDRRIISHDSPSNQRKDGSSGEVRQTFSSRETPPVNLTEVSRGFESNYDYAQQQVRLQFRHRMPTWNPFWQIWGVLGILFGIGSLGFATYGFTKYGLFDMNFIMAIAALSLLGVLLIAGSWFFFFSRFWRLIYVRLLHTFWWVEPSMAEKMNMPLSFRQRYQLWVRKKVETIYQIPMKIKKRWAATAVNTGNIRDTSELSETGPDLLVKKSGEVVEKISGLNSQKISGVSIGKRNDGEY